MSYILAVVSAACYGFNIFAIHLGTRSERVGSNKILIINLLSGTLILSLIAILTFLRTGVPQFTLKGILMFGAAGFSGPFLGRMFSITSIKRIGGTRTSTLRMGETFLTMFLAFIVLDERLSPVSFVGAVILVAGIVLLIKERGVSPKTRYGENPAIPSRVSERKPLSPQFVFAFLAALFFAVGRVFHRLGLSDLPSPLIGALVGTSIALLTNAVYGLASGQMNGVLRISRRSMVFFVLSGFGNSLGLLTLMLALNRGGLLSLVVALKNTSPLFTLLLGSLFLRDVERVSFGLVVSVLIVLAGAILIVL
jgi:uncharacterized membrane protein